MMALVEPQTYTALLAFNPVNGGVGLDIAANGTGAVYALPGAAQKGQAFQAYNDGAVAYWIAFGKSDVAASVAGLPVPPGALVAYTLPTDGSYTHLAVRTRGTATTGTINFGSGT